MKKTEIRSTGLYIIDQEEVMEERYHSEVGDIIQVTCTDLETRFYKLGDIGRVVSSDGGVLEVDFSISKHPFVHLGVSVWQITETFTTKINVIEEG